MTFDERKHTTIVDQFKSGRSVRDIAADMGVTRQRIYQMLRRHGLTGEHGGQAVRMSIRRSVKEKAESSRYQEVYGCTKDQFEAIRGERSDKSGSPLIAFRHQRNHARSRGVSWDLKFWDWWSIWRDSGKWPERGRSIGSFCMCRLGDTGPYSVGNVYIATVTHNISLGRALACERKTTPSAFMKLMRAAGGRQAVARALDVAPAYLSQLANDGRMPVSWIDDGKAKVIVSMTAGLYTLDDVMQITSIKDSAPQNRRSNFVVREEKSVHSLLAEVA